MSVKHRPSGNRSFDRGLQRLMDGQAGPRPPDACPICSQPHHTDLIPALVPPAKDGHVSPMVDPVVKDAIWHVTIDAYRALTAAHDTDAALELMPAIAAGLGWLIGAVEERGRRRGQAEGVERFFDGLVKAQGYGRYEIEIAPNSRAARRADA